MGEATADAGHIADTTDPRSDERRSILTELRDSAMLIGLTLSTMGAYLAVGAVVVRIFANR